MIKRQLGRGHFDKIVKALDILVKAITGLNKQILLIFFSGTFSDFNDNAVIFISYSTFNSIDKIVELL